MFYPLITLSARPPTTQSYPRFTLTPNIIYWDRRDSDEIMVTFSHINEFETAMMSNLPVTPKFIKICTIKNTTIRNLCFL